MAGSRLPVIGPWKAKITRIDKMAMMDCSPNAIVFVLGVSVAAFNVFWAIAGPECIDSTWDRIAKPGRKHRKFQTNGTSFGPTIGPPKGKLGVTAIAIGNAAQKIGFALGIVDGILDGVFYGASLMRRYSGCHNNSAPYGECRMLNTVPALFPAGTFIINSWERVGDNVFAAGPTGVAVTGPFSNLVTAAYGLSQETGKFPPLPDCSFTSQAVWLPSGDPVQQNWGGLGHNITGSGVLYGQDILRHPVDSALGVKVTKTEGVMYLSSAFFNVIGGSFAGTFDPYKCGGAKTSL